MSDDELTQISMDPMRLEAESEELANHIVHAMKTPVNRSWSPFPSVVAPSPLRISMTPASLDASHSSLAAQDPRLALSHMGPPSPLSTQSTDLYGGNQPRLEYSHSQPLPSNGQFDIHAFPAGLLQYSTSLSAQDLSPQLFADLHLGQPSASLPSDSSFPPLLLPTFEEFENTQSSGADSNSTSFQSRN
jgi:hypothetical protein